MPERRWRLAADDRELSCGDGEVASSSKADAAGESGQPSMSDRRAEAESGGEAACRSLRRRGRMGECGIAAERLGGREGAEAGVVMFSLFEGGGIIAGDGVPPSEPI